MTVLQLVKKVRVSESAIQNEQHQHVTDACTKGSENEHSLKSVKSGDMRGGFDSLQLSPPGNSKNDRRKQKKTGSRTLFGCPSCYANAR